jgi:hypothetical protein
MRVSHLFVLALFAGLTGVRGDVVSFTDLGNGGSFGGTFDIISGAGTFNGRFEDGYKFMAGAGGKITKISVGMGLTTGNNVLYLDLFADKGNYPETLVKAWTFNNMLPVIQKGQQQLPALTKFDVKADNINITKGQNYWLIAASDPNAVILWFRNNTGAANSEAWRRNNGNYNISFGNATLDAFQVEVANPEPSSLAIAGLGGLLCLGYSWCRRNSSGTG